MPRLWGSASVLDLVCIRAAHPNRTESKAIFPIATRSSIAVGPKFA
jgi:hypothetical protein